MRGVSVPVIESTLITIYLRKTCSGDVFQKTLGGIHHSAIRSCYIKKKESYRSALVKKTEESFPPEEKIGSDYVLSGNLRGLARYGDNAQ